MTEETQSRHILMVRSLEEADALGALLPWDKRDRASGSLGPPAEEAGDEEVREALARRAETLLKSAPEATRQAVSRALRFPPGWARLLAPGLLLGAFVLGVLSNALGPTESIDVLSFPLLGLVAWNLCVYGCLAWRALRSRKTANQRAAWFDFSQARDKLLEKQLGEINDAKEKDIVSRGMGRFFSLWSDLWASWQQARGAMIFHAAALALAIGVVVGMYGQGLRKEYRATWESTFLDAPGVHRVLNIALGPAAFLTGIEIPSVATLAKMRRRPEAPAEGGDAAPFIHLYAATAGIFILLPRLLLTVASWKQCRKARPDFAQILRPIYDSVRQSSQGKAPIIKVVPVHYTPESLATETLRLVAMHVWGGKVRLDFLPKVEIGEEDLYFQAPRDWGTEVIALFPLNMTPELELHGEIIQAIKERSSRVVAVLDALAYEKRLAGMPEQDERLKQRRQAWERVLGNDFHVLVLDEASRKAPERMARL